MNRFNVFFLFFSGLDSSTSTQVVSLLKKLAQEGRTIISTIHQPSAIVFGMFDHMYAVAEGKCIFTGSTQSLIPFLSDLDLVCPESYNPTDYRKCVLHIINNLINIFNLSLISLVLEISTHDYGFQNDRLIEKTQNGLEIKYRKQNKNLNTAQTYSMETAGKFSLNTFSKLSSGVIINVNFHFPCNRPSYIHLLFKYFFSHFFLWILFTTTHQKNPYKKKT